MLTLSLLRHAKSDWSSPGLDDFHRPLARRGEEAAPKMGIYMAAKGVEPDLILCSSAVRTRQTLDLVLPHLKGKPKVVFEDGLYLASATAMLARLHKVGTKLSHVLMVGHDPGMHELAILLAGAGEPEKLEALTQKFPTAGLAVLTFKAKDWSEVGADSGRLERFMAPKRLD